MSKAFLPINKMMILNPKIQVKRVLALLPNLKHRHKVQHKFQPQLLKKPFWLSFQKKTTTLGRCSNKPWTKKVKRKTKMNFRWRFQSQLNQCPSNLLSVRQFKTKESFNWSADQCRNLEFKWMILTIWIDRIICLLLKVPQWFKCHQNMAFLNLKSRNLHHPKKIMFSKWSKPTLPNPLPSVVMQLA